MHYRLSYFYPLLSMPFTPSRSILSIFPFFIFSYPQKGVFLRSANNK
ncbi:hypothetical protein SB48_HM08orf02635 [Heyndrickxia coagulans]|uniref:Uncharacterized protein n=1 Tax=Heyndrickxia coagulans TaxID=1398 RepID=A0AAN0T620_HEYCO|nr:hypothetical protein SB48_HM08orf02635 [Heyndrickxia coagulans]